MPSSTVCLAVGLLPALNCDHQISPETAIALRGPFAGSWELTAVQPTSRQVDAPPRLAALNARAPRPLQPREAALRPARAGLPRGLLEGRGPQGRLLWK